MFKIIKIFLFVFLLSWSILYSQNDFQAELEYLERYIGDWPPSTTNEDSLKYFEDRLNSYIEKIKNGTYSFEDSSTYYLRLGEAYRFGHNIDMEGAYDLADKYLNKAYLLNPKSFEIRMNLGVFYASTSPETIFKAYPLFHSIINDDPEGKYPMARYNLALIAPIVGEDYFGRMAALQYKELMPEDTMTSNFLIENTHRLYNKYILKDTVESMINYQNSFTGFSVNYPIDLKVFREEVYSNRNQSSVLNLYTPLTPTVLNDSITNAVVIMAESSEHTKFKDVIRIHIENTNSEITGQRKPNILTPYKTQSVYFEAPRPLGEKYKGIYTVIKGEEYNYLITYVATTSTYDKNLNYYEDFEKSFKRIEIKRDNK